MQRIWILSAHYYPEEVATSHILSRIAEGLTDEYEMRVICTQPSYHQRGAKALTHEIHNNVHIYRCWSTNLDRNVIWKRLINLITISLSIFLAALFRIRSGDTMLVVTDPPLLPFLTKFAAWLRRAKVVLLAHDVYPEVVVASGIAEENSLIVRLVRWANKKLYRAMDHIVVIGRDMKVLALEKIGPRLSQEANISIIPNWADIDKITPTARAENSLLIKLGLQDKFVIQYAGNMGFVHDIETIITAATLLRDLSHVHFLFIGSGAKQDWLEEEIERHGLSNVTKIGQQPRSEQNIFLNACDVAIMALLPGMLGVSVPSRTYNILAAGKPILGILHKDAETAQMVIEENIGWCVEPQNPAALDATIREISSQTDTVEAMRIRARSVAEDKYTAEHALEKFRAMFAKVTNA